MLMYILQILIVKYSFGPVESAELTNKPQPLTALND